MNLLQASYYKVQSDIHAGGPGSGRHKVYGAVTNVKTGKDLDWSGADHTKVLNDIKILGSTTYGKHWKMAGDLDVEDKEAGINVNHANGSEKFFHGKDAVSELKDHLEKLK